jgi:hypothetical protein
MANMIAGGTSPRRPMWIAIWGAAIFVTLIGGNPETANWKPYIQIPGSFVVLYVGYFIGPLGSLFTPLVVRILTILTNVVVYYVLVVMTLFLRRKFRTAT